MLGRGLMALIAGVASFVLLLITGTPFPLLLALWVLLADVLPIVGGFLQFVIIVPIALFHSLGGGIAVAIVWLVYMQFENHILNPVVLSRAVKMSALVVLLAVLVGASLGDVAGSIFGGLIGALFAIPVAGADPGDRPRSVVQDRSGGGGGLERVTGWSWRGRSS